MEGHAMKKVIAKTLGIAIGIAKLATFLALFPLVALGALGVTVYEICDRNNWN
jgi:hypothetical protein